MPFWVDSSMPLSRTSQVLWSNVEGKPKWFDLVSGGDTPTTPLQIDMQAGYLKSHKENPTEGNIQNRENISVNKKYVDDKLIGVVDVAYLNTNNAEKTLETSKAYTDAELAKLKWADLKEKPEWTSKIAGDASELVVEVPINMKQNKLINVNDPTLVGDVANMGWVMRQKDELQTNINTQFVNLTDNYKDYVQNYEAQTRPKYDEWLSVDDRDEYLKVNGNIDLEGYSIYNLAANTTDKAPVRNKELNDKLGEVNLQIDGLEENITGVREDTDTNTASIVTLTSSVQTLENGTAQVEWANVQNKPSHMFGGVDGVNDTIQPVTDDPSVVKIIKDLNLNGNSIFNVGQPATDDDSGVVTVGYLKSSKAGEFNDASYIRDVERVVTSDMRSIYVSTPIDSTFWADASKAEMSLDIKTVPGPALASKGHVYVKEAEAFVTVTKYTSGDITSFGISGAQDVAPLSRTPEGAFLLSGGVLTLEDDDVSDKSVHVWIRVKCLVDPTEMPIDPLAPSPTSQEIYVALPPIKVPLDSQAIVSS